MVLKESDLDGNEGIFFFTKQQLGKKCISILLTIFFKDCLHAELNNK